MILATHGIVGSQIVEFTGLLDTYTGAAAAYSLRKLRSAYTGSAIRVRRSSDNSEQDIGFVNNELDTSSLLSFVGTGGTDNGFVKTWYDQSGNANDAAQTTVSNQPQIVSSGSVITENSKPSVQFDGTDDFMSTSSNNVLHSVDWTFLMVANSNPSSTAIWITVGTGTGGEGRIILDLSGVGNNTIGYNGFNSGSTLKTYTKNIQQLTSIIGTNHQTSLTASVSAFVNTVSGSTYTSTSVQTIGSNQPFGIGYNLFSPGLYMPMKSQELVFYNSDQSSNRTGIETNINDFYSIYP